MRKAELDERIYDTLCALYEKGALVEAVSVAGIDDGTRGIVQSVRRTGDVQVDFDKYGEIIVQYPKEIIRVVHTGPGCILKMKRGSDGCRDDCNRCAWNPLVDKKRRAAIHAGEMVRQGNLSRLVVAK